MKVYLEVALPTTREVSAISNFASLESRDRYKVHSLTSDPEDADIIIFVDPHQHSGDWRLKSIRSHPITRRYPHKVFVYDERDRPWCCLPGIYVSMPKSAFDLCSQRSWTYHALMNASKKEDFAKSTLDFLFSFIGNRSHKVREDVFNLTHSRACIENANVAFFDFSTTRNEEAIQLQKDRFNDVLYRSKFILCPRGVGTSSIRMYETLAAGRVPVIISDEWVEPLGPRWDLFSLRVKESDVKMIPSLLEKREKDFEVMSGLASQAYLEWFSSESLFHHFIENYVDIMEKREQGKTFNAKLRFKGYINSGKFYGIIAAKRQLLSVRNYLRSRLSPK